LNNSHQTATQQGKKGRRTTGISWTNF